MLTAIAYNERVGFFCIVLLCVCVNSVMEGWMKMSKLLCWDHCQIYDLQRAFVVVSNQLIF